MPINISESELENWIRHSRGRRFDFFATDDDIVEFLHAFLPPQFAPYSILGTFMVKEGNTYKETYLSSEMDGFLALRAKDIWSFFIQSHVLSPDLSIEDTPYLDRLLASNGLIIIQQQLACQRKGFWPQSSLALVDKVRNINTGEILEHKDYLKIFNKLKRGVRKSLRYPVKFIWTDGKTEESKLLMTENFAFECSLQCQSGVIEKASERRVGRA
jgi:hypothetical protein